jgi:hypothetical protein
MRLHGAAFNLAIVLPQSMIEIDGRADIRAFIAAF